MSRLGGFPLLHQLQEGFLRCFLFAQKPVQLLIVRSGVLNLRGYDGEENVMPEPNTNLMVPRTLIPTLRAKLSAGENTLVSAVFGSITADKATWENPPTEVLVYGKMD